MIAFQLFYNSYYKTSAGTDKLVMAGREGSGFFSFAIRNCNIMLARMLNAPLSTVNHRTIFLDNISTILRTGVFGKVFGHCHFALVWSHSVCVQETPSNSL